MKCVKCGSKTFGEGCICEQFVVRTQLFGAEEVWASDDKMAVYKYMRNKNLTGREKITADVGGKKFQISVICLTWVDVEEID